MEEVIIQPENEEEDVGLRRSNRLRVKGNSKGRRNLRRRKN